MSESEREKQESRLWQAERSWLKKGPAALLAHLRQAAENGPGVLPLQRHAERLEELLSALTSSQAEAGRVEAAELTPGFDRNRAPAPPSGFGNEGNELQALATAKSFCVLKAALAVLVGGSDLPRMKGRRSHGAALEATGDGQVESGRAADAPGRKIHIGWAPAGWLAGARFAGTKFGRTRRKQSELLNLGAQASRSRPGGDHSPEAVVPLHSVPPTRTGAGVVPEAVGSPVAQWAEAIGACNREPEPHAEQNPKEGGLQVQPQCLGRPGGQPRTSSKSCRWARPASPEAETDSWASWALSREVERSCCLGGRTVAAVMCAAASTAALNRSTEAVVVGQSVA